MTEEYISKYLQEISSAASKIDQEKIQKIIEIIFEAWKEGKTVYMFGNGGSATLALHFETDLGKGTFVEGKRRISVECLSANPDLITALTNDNGWENLYLDQIKGRLNQGDVLAAFSVHGGKGADKAGVWSQNILKAIDYAKREGVKTVGFSGFDGGAMKDVCDTCLVIPASVTGQVQDLQLSAIHIICDILRMRIEKS